MAAIEPPTLQEVVPIGHKSTIVRGRLTVPDRGITQTFMFNPSEVKDEKSINWGTLLIPGASHPILQSGSGGERLIIFTLYFDGDRGRFDRNINEARNLGIDATAPQESVLSVRRAVQFYQALVYPGDTSSFDYKAAFPFVSIFTMGPIWDGVPVLVKRAAANYTYFTPKMEPVRATLDIQLSEQPVSSVSSQEIFPNFDLG